KAGRDYGRITAKQPFKSAHGRVKHGMMSFQESDELAHFRLIRRKLASVLGDFDKAVAVARFLDLRKKEIQFDKIDVLDFICPAFNELSRGHKRRHMTSHAQS